MNSPLVSIILPSCNERFLPNTINDILAKATGNIQVIAVLDGYWPNVKLPEDPKLDVIHHSTQRGMRAAINHGVSIARGEYLIKCDAHCMFTSGFDETLLQNIDDDWIVMPRRDRLDAENWARQETGKPPIDLHYLSCPLTNKDGFSMHGVIWPERDRKLLNEDISETPSFQGSFWMMSRKHWHRIGGMPEEFYGGFTQEPQQLGMKTWLSGGKVMVNKNTTYYHLHKGKLYGRGYRQDRNEILEGHQASAIYWMNNSWSQQIYTMDWFVDKFNMPTWPANWQELWAHHKFNKNQIIDQAG